jgi:hypothetical protein
MCIECDVEGDVARCMSFLRDLTTCSVDEHRVRTDTLRGTGDLELGWMDIIMYVVLLAFSILLSRPLGWAQWTDVLSSSGFGQKMGGSPMMIMWPSHDEDGSYASTTLSQRKAPFEVMQKPDMNPPFTAALDMEPE